MKQCLILFFLFISFDLFSQISLPTYHATYIVKTQGNNFQAGDPLIIAGGGGGVIYWLAGHPENHASITESGNKGNDYYLGHRSSYSWASSSVTVLGGINGNGGNSSRGGGGGGFLTDGGAHSSKPETRGRSFDNGGQGGTTTDGNCGNGGFGGGGAGTRASGIEEQGAGGGGGYSGGAGGGDNNRAHGGGGGSYNEGSNQVNATYPNGNNGSGKVIITQGGSTWTFNSCGVSGKNGPTQNQCNSSYSGGSLAGNVTLVDGIQHWTVPTTATYTIKAYGAKGGNQTWTGGGGGYFGGHAAIMQGDFNLSSGNVLKILVGQEAPTVNYVAGGGGGTFVVLSN